MEETHWKNVLLLFCSQNSQLKKTFPSYKIICSYIHSLIGTEQVAITFKFNKGWCVSTPQKVQITKLKSPQCNSFYHARSEDLAPEQESRQCN